MNIFALPVIFLFLNVLIVMPLLLTVASNYLFKSEKIGWRKTMYSILVAEITCLVIHFFIYQDYTKNGETDLGLLPLARLFLLCTLVIMIFGSWLHIGADFKGQLKTRSMKRKTLISIYLFLFALAVIVPLVYLRLIYGGTI